MAIIVQQNLHPGSSQTYLQTPLSAYDYTVGHFTNTNRGLELNSLDHQSNASAQQQTSSNGDMTWNMLNSPRTYHHL